MDKQTSTNCSAERPGGSLVWHGHALRPQLSHRMTDYGRRNSGEEAAVRRFKVRCERLLGEEGRACSQA